MLEFLPSLGSLITFGSNSAVTKKAINDIGRHKSIVYMYIVLVALLVLGAIVLHIEIQFPYELVPEYILEITMGALGVIAAFKAINYGKVSITSPIAKIYALFVLVLGIVILGEELSIGQIIGAATIVISAIIIALDKTNGLKLEKWMIYLGISILCRAYYYTFIKTFVVSMGAYQATLFLEFGVALLVIGFHILRGRDISTPTLKEMKFPALSGGLSFFGTLFYSLSVGWIGAALTAVISAGSPTVNAIMARILLGEKLDMYWVVAQLRPSSDVMFYST